MRLFITGSGTDVGKTFVTCLLARQLRARGIAVAALKPIITGFDTGNTHCFHHDAANGTDTQLLLDACGLPMNEHSFYLASPMVFRAPLSPDMAARLEGTAIDFESLITHCNTSRPLGDHDCGALLIEGVGGVMVPLNDRYTVLDWISALAIPALVVVGSYLGALSHALTAILALQTRGIEIAGIVVNESSAGGISTMDTKTSLSAFVKDTEIVCMPRLKAAAKRATSQPGVPDLSRLALASSTAVPASTAASSTAASSTTTLPP